MDLKSLAKKILDQAYSEAAKNFGQYGGRAMSAQTRSWIQNKYPGSQHWDPNKVNPVSEAENTARIDIDIPGAGRAYHDVDIYPKNANWLAIPLHAAARGRNPREFKGLFKPKNKNILALVQNNALVAMYALSKHVHQNQDSSLLPSDDNILENLAEEFIKHFDQAVDNAAAAL